jgi:hypothetical protein
MHSCKHSQSDPPSSSNAPSTAPGGFISTPSAQWLPLAVLTTLQLRPKYENCGFAPKNVSPPYSS